MAKSTEGGSAFHSRCKPPTRPVVDGRVVPCAIPFQKPIGISPSGSTLTLTRTLTEEKEQNLNDGMSQTTKIKIICSFCKNPSYFPLFLSLPSKLEVPIERPLTLTPTMGRNNPNRVGSTMVGGAPTQHVFEASTSAMQKMGMPAGPTCGLAAPYQRHSPGSEDISGQG